MLMFDTTTLSPMTRTTSPCLPLSLPAVTTTRSPFLIRFISFSLQSGAASLRPAFTSLCRSEHFRCERDDLHESLGTHFTGQGPEDARADRLGLVVEQHCAVAVNTAQPTVRHDWKRRRLGTSGSRR